MELARQMGHTPVRAKDMPGFIVNHAGRGMNIEGLKTAQESVAPYYQVNAIMREQAGIRMGPFELLDLTALYGSQPVIERTSVVSGKGVYVSVDRGGSRNIKKET